MIIYADVLIFLNTIVTYFMLISVCAVFKKREKAFRLVLGSLIGGLSALTIFLPQLSFILEVIIKSAVCSVITLTVFSYKNYIYFLKHCLCLLGVTYIFAGAVIGIYSIFKPYSLVYSNGVAYFDISPLILITLTTVAYLIIRLFLLFKKNTTSEVTVFDCEIEYKGAVIPFLAVNDTGNSLCDPYFNSPVAIIEKGVTTDIPKDSLKTYLIPINSVGTDSVISAFRPDGFYIKINNRRQKIDDITVAVCEKKLNKQYRGIISPKILQFVKEDDLCLT